MLCDFILIGWRCISALREMPIAIKTDEPKVQHYELPTSFFKLVLGKNLKYRQTTLLNAALYLIFSFDVSWALSECFFKIN